MGDRLGTPGAVGFLITCLTVLCIYFVESFVYIMYVFLSCRCQTQGEILRKNIQLLKFILNANVLISSQELGSSEWIPGINVDVHLPQKKMFKYRSCCHGEASQAANTFLI